MKHWILALSVILIVALSAIGATAEGLEIIPEESLKVLMPEEEVTELEDFDLRGDTEDTMPVQEAGEQLVSVSTERVVSNDGDFEIINGVLVKYNGAGGDVVIPDGVTSIGKAAFQNARNLNCVTIPNGVKNIGEQAFEGCSLTEINCPDTKTVIGMLYVIARSRRFACDVAIWFPCNEILGRED